MSHLLVYTQDRQQLINVLKKLRDIGNSVIVVEHDEDMMMSADEIDIGPGEGRYGGGWYLKETIKN